MELLATDLADYAEKLAAEVTEGAEKLK